MADDRFDFALRLIADAGKLALGFFEARDTLTITSKGVQDVVSEADVETEKLIRRRLAVAFPGDAFLGEETGASDYAEGQGIWVVDPIDGTQPFVSGMSGWCVSIGFLRNGTIEFGMVNAPARNELFAGGTNHAATLNGMPVNRHPGKKLNEGIVAAGYSPRVGPREFLPAFERLLQKGGTFYREGSGALALAYVAAGRLLGYMEPHINSWDCLGALAIIEAAGLKHSDFLTSDGLRRGNRLWAGNDEVFAELTAIMDQV